MKLSLVAFVLLLAGCDAGFIDTSIELSKNITNSVVETVVSAPTAFFRSAKNIYHDLANGTKNLACKIIISCNEVRKDNEKEYPLYDYEMVDSTEGIPSRR